MENENNQNKPEKKSPEVKKRHPFVRFLFIIGFIFIILELIFLFFATPILRKTISSTVETKSNGVYSIHFDSLSVDLGGRSFIFFGLELRPNPEIYRQLKKEKKIKRGLYQFKFKTLKLKNIKLFKLINERKLDFNELLIDSPDIKLHDLPLQKKKNIKKYKAVEKDLYPALLDILYSIKIKKINILHGNFDFWLDEKQKNKKASAENIGFELTDFYLDADTYMHNKKYLFYAQQTLIHLNNYKLALKDKIHSLRVKNITIDTKRKELIAKSLSLLPNLISRKQRDTLTSSLSELNVPFLKLSGFDITKVMYQKNINISELYIQQPKITLYQNKHPGKKINIDYTLNFFPLIKGILNSVKIDEFIMEQAILNIYGKNHKSLILKCADLDVRLHHFLLNKSSYLDKNKLFGAGNIDLAAQRLSFHLKDSIHILNLKQIKISTISHKMSIIRLIVSNLPITDSSTLKTIFSINIPEIRIRGFNLKKLIHEKYLPIWQLIIKNSDLKINNFARWNKNTQKQNKAFRKWFFYYFKRLYIHEFWVDNMAIKYQQKAQKDSALFQSLLNLKVFNLRLNPQLIKQPEKFFFSDSFRVQLVDFKLKKQSQISFDTLYSSSVDSLFRIKNFSILPGKYQKRKLSLKVPEMSIFRIDFNKSFFHRHLVLDSVVILKPEIRLSIFQNDSLFNKTTVGSKWKATKDSLLNDKSKLRLKDLALFKSLSFIIDTINIRSINLQNGNLYLSKIKPNGHKQLSFNNKLSAKLHHFYLNMNMNVDSVKNSEKFFFTDTLIIDFHDYVLDFPDGIHTLKVKRLSANSATHNIRLSNITISPDLKKISSKKQKWVYWKIPDAEIQGIDYRKLLLEKELIAKKFIVDTSVFRYYADRDSANQFKRREFKFNKIKLPKNINLVQFDEIELLPTEFYAYSADSNFTFFKANTQLFIDNFRIDSLNTQKKSIPVEDFQLNINNLDLCFADSTKKVSVQNAMYSSISKYFSANNIQVYYQIDTSEQHYLIKTKGPSLLRMNIRQFSAEGMDFDELLRRNLQIKYAELAKPTIYSYSLKTTDTSGAYQRTNWYQKIYPYFDTLKIAELNFSDAKIHSRQIIKKDSIKNLDLNLSGSIYNFTINKQHAIKIPKYFYKENADVTLSNFKLYSKDSSYILNIPNLHARTKDSTVWITNFSYKPLLSPEEFVRKNKKGYIALDSLCLEAYKANFDLFFLAKAIQSPKIVIKQFKFIAFTDNNFPPDSVTKGQMLMDLFESFSYKTSIDTIRIKKAKVEYSLRTKNAPQIGIIDINHIRGDIFKLSNDSNQYFKWPVSFFDLNMTIYKNSNLGLKIKIYPKTLNNFKLTGSLSNFDLTLMNQFLKPSYSIAIRSGYTNNTRFYIEGNQKIEEGKLRFEYNGLKISILKTRKDSLQKKRGFSSYLANTVLRRNNPRRGSLVLKEGSIYLVRNSFDSFISFWLNGLMEGIKATIGLRSKEVRRYDRFQKMLQKAKYKGLSFIQMDENEKPMSKRKSRKVLRWSKKMKEEEKKFSNFKQKH